MIRTLRDERGGSELVTFVPTLVLVFFVFLAGAVLLHLCNVRAMVHMAAREGARTYGITHSSDKAALKAWECLKETKMIPSNTPYPKQHGKGGHYTVDNPRIKSIDFHDNGEWTTCSVKYRFLKPNPFRNLPRLVLDSHPWKPDGFDFTVEGAAKHEYQP